MGKETATLLCDISDYYDESGEKVIDITTNKMSFRLHDEVIPYVYGADGKDKPMSKKQDGSAKVFEVVGSNIIYDGAVWQEFDIYAISSKSDSYTLDDLELANSGELLEGYMVHFFKPIVSQYIGMFLSYSSSSKNMNFIVSNTSATIQMSDNATVYYDIVTEL